MSVFIVSIYMCSLVCCNDMAIFRCWWITSKGQWKKCLLFFINNLINFYITLIHVTFNKMEILQHFKYLESWLNVNQCCCFLFNKSVHIQTINLHITGTKTVKKNKQKKTGIVLNINCFDDCFSLSFSVVSRNNYTAFKPDPSKPNMLRVGLAFGSTALLWALVTQFKWSLIYTNKLTPAFKFPKHPLCSPTAVQTTQHWCAWVQNKEWVRVIHKAM